MGSGAATPLPLAMAGLTLPISERICDSVGVCPFLPRQSLFFQ